MKAKLVTFNAHTGTTSTRFLNHDELTIEHSILCPETDFRDFLMIQYINDQSGFDGTFEEWITAISNSLTPQPNGEVVPEQPPVQIAEVDDFRQEEEEREADMLSRKEQVELMIEDISNYLAVNLDKGEYFQLGDSALQITDLNRPATQFLLHLMTTEWQGDRVGIFEKRIPERIHEGVHYDEVALNFLAVEFKLGRFALDEEDPLSKYNVMEYILAFFDERKDVHEVTFEELEKLGLGNGKIFLGVKNHGIQRKEPIANHEQHTIQIAEKNYFLPLLVLVFGLYFDEDAYRFSLYETHTWTGHLEGIHWGEKATNETDTLLPNTHFLQEENGFTKARFVNELLELTNVHPEIKDYDLAPELEPLLDIDGLYASLNKDDDTDTKDDSVSASRLTF